MSNNYDKKLNDFYILSIVKKYIFFDKKLYIVGILYIVL